MSTRNCSLTAVAMIAMAVAIFSPPTSAQTERSVSSGSPLVAITPDQLQQRLATTIIPPAAQWPPLEVYIHPLSDSGDYRYITLYHADGTFNWTYAATQGRKADISVGRYWQSSLPLTGRWWRQGATTFCYVVNQTKYAGQTFCNDGRLMGRVALDGTLLR